MHHAHHGHNARFWTYANGSLVKLTVRPGQVLHWHEGGPTDEGYHWEGHAIAHTGHKLIEEVTIRSRDCDGRFDKAYSLETALPIRRGDEDRFIIDQGEPVLTWTEVPRSYQQRDYSAEAMGY